jgi:hypothetical protein
MAVNKTSRVRSRWSLESTRIVTGDIIFNDVVRYIVDGLVDGDDAVNSR